MQKIRNPFLKIPGYNCFGCSPNNPSGLHMDFYLDGDAVVSEWEPGMNYQGYGNILHGGVQATLMDEIGAWGVYILVKTAGVTSKMEVRFKKPVTIDGGKLTVRASLKEMKRNIAVMFVQIKNSTGDTCSESDIYYYTYPPEKAKEKLYFPEYSEYFEE